MAKLYDIDGNEVEAFTPEELKAKQDEAVAEHLKNNPDKSAELDKLRTELADATKKLEEAAKGGNDQQKARLRSEKEAAEAALKDVTDKLSGEINALKETFTAGTKNKIMNALTKGDKDLQAKIDLKYNSLMKTGDYPSTEEGIAQALSEAATLVTGSKPTPNFMDNISGAGDRGATQKPGEAKVETPNAKAMRNVLGITDKDAEKYGGVDATKAV
jgi:hypothetical protein